MAIWRKSWIFVLFIVFLLHIADPSRGTGGFLSVYVPAGNSRLFSPPRAPPVPRLGLFHKCIRGGVTFSVENMGL
jgi:hypothetical protein